LAYLLFELGRNKLVRLLLKKIKKRNSKIKDLLFYLPQHTPVDPHIWHARLPSPDGKLSDDGLIQAPEDCVACQEGKMITLPHQRSNGPDEYQPGDLIVGDYKLVKESNRMSVSSF
jgi:hypothetical protein